MAATTRIQLSPAFLLHRTPYRETSALLEVFSEQHGRIGLVARGLRSARSRLRGELQPFRPLRLSWNMRGELGTLSGAEPDGAVGTLEGAALYSAFYLNELLLRLLARQDPHPQLFRHYRRSLERLARGDEVEAVLRVFERDLLEALGYGLLLEYEAGLEREVQADRYYDYHLEAGPVAVAAADAPGFIVRGSSLLALARGELRQPAERRDAKRLMRAALELYIGERPLRSRELFRAATDSGRQRPP
ncbi:MAG TPA: DNA repair protein RecO [Gammaproteobacteria bacterium]|nr:DNA repair protein RecO [Gammaproteobacteria bacterium]